MFTKQIAFIVVLTLLVSASAFAQGEFVKPGENAFGATGLRTFGDGTKGFGAGIGFTIQGVIDLAFAYTNNTDADVQSYSPSITGYTKKVYNKGMYGAGITVGYVRTKAESSSWYRPGTIETNNLLLGVSMFNNFYLSDQVMLQVSGSGALWIILSDSSEETTGAGNLGATLVFARRQQFRPFIGVSVTIPEEDAYPGISAGFVTVW